MNLVVKNKERRGVGAGGLKEKGLTNFLPPEKGLGGGGLLEKEGLFERGGFYIEDLQWYSFIWC